MIIEIDSSTWAYIENTINAATLNTGDALRISIIPSVNPSGHDSIDLKIIPPPYAMPFSWHSTYNTPSPLPWSVNQAPIVTPDPTIIIKEDPQPKKEIDYSKITKSLSGK
jgi:hypothetical protein